MSRYYVERKSLLIAGTAILGAVVAVLEVSRFLRIPFPLFMTLKFDVVGIPMVLTYFLFGLIPGLSTCFISLAIISFRNPFSGFMKCTAEAATIIGAFIVLKTKGTNTSYKMLAVGASILMRVIVMSIANLLFLPVFYPLFYETIHAVIFVLPFICLFNAIQGLISIFGGYSIYEAVTLRLPSLRI